MGNSTNDLVSEDNSGKAFFRRIDWASFWTATIISFLVYFFTLGPSVGLEDSGELAVAGDHLGVPHPPGYPIWTIISYLFVRIFSFVTFRGQPNPAWAISLASGVFGALTAGCTAMLITRSASDMLSDAKTIIKRGQNAINDFLCFTGGVAGSLIFAFSPVMWSQSTIVEVYALGAFFLMLVMLLSYRWMRRPSDKILWITAFVFGLGLTNYQVLLLAALPLVVIIFLRNIALFRDFILVAIPFALGALILKLGAMPPQSDLMKHFPVQGEVLIPSGGMCVVALIFFALAFFAIFFYLWKNGRKGDDAKEKSVVFEMVIVVLFILSILFLILSSLPITAAHAVVGRENPMNTALLEPVKYLWFGIIFVAISSLAAYGAIFGGELKSKKSLFALSVIIVLFLIGWIMAVAIGKPDFASRIDLASYPVLNIGHYHLGFCASIFLFLGLGAITSGGIFFVVPIAAIEIILYTMVANGALLGLTHPSTWWFWAPVVFNFVVLALASVTLPSGKSVALTFLATEAGVSFYAYMPIVSDLRNPPMNWGYPRTWEGFKHAITRGQYEKITPTDIFTPRFISQIGDYFTDLRRQFTLLLAPFGFLPFAAWRLNSETLSSDERRKKVFQLSALALTFIAVILWGIDSFVPADAIGDAAAKVLRCFSVVALLLAIVAVVLGGMRPLAVAVILISITMLFVVLGNISKIEGNFDESRIDKLTFGGLLLVSVIGGIYMTFKQLETAVLRIINEKNLSLTITVGLVASGVVLISAAIFYKITQAVIVFISALSRNSSVGYIGENWSSLLAFYQSSSPLLVTVFPIILSLTVVASAIFALVLLTKRKAISISLDDVTQQWIIGTVCNFFVMSILLICLANPKGDLQDTFIQKVKFISSHGLFALWIGYGLIFALLVLDGFFSFITKKKALAKGLIATATVFVFFSFAIPIEQNYFNERLVFELSSAEQNGHDYGWQFGNYQLRGSDAIIEELDDDEEPLPNPSYPPEMGQGAVFFGGTDPGRFVPTYMIYSANVRPDVFLITQNALADNTFMSVTRDLYGDQIWIPTPRESEEAFNSYVRDIQSGKKQTNADVSVENGRVQIVGALGVMEINGILCKMIFDHNKPGAYKNVDGTSGGHEFYVEESYVIPWMYPYLTPHGLIMHINANPTPLSSRIIENDLDFWDWYTRRLTSDVRYRRDVVAQKSFSKLRSAIAGLYMNRGRHGDSETAYNQARILYPVSPEANFRTIQDVLVRQGRFKEALEIVDYFCEKDPNNDRGPMLRGYVQEIEKAKTELDALLASAISPAKYTVANAIRICELSLQFGNVGQALMIARDYANVEKITAGECFALAGILSECGESRLAATTMSRVVQSKYVQENPKRIMEAVKIYLGTGDVFNVDKLLVRYLSHNPTDWKACLEIASIAAQIGNEKLAMRYIEQSIKIGREHAVVVISGNELLAALAEKMLKNQQQRPGSVLPVGAMK